MPEIRYIITADESGAIAGVKRVHDAATAAATGGASAVGGLTGAFGGLGAAVGSVASLFGGLAIAGIIGQQTQAAVAFQQEWTKVQVILRDDKGGAAGLEHFKQQILDLPPIFGTAAENAQAFYTIVSSGFTDPAQALILLKNAAIAAAGGFTTTEIAVRTGAAVLQAYGIAVEDSQHVFDVMAKTVDLGVISFEELASQLGNVIPIAAANNVTFEEVTASIAAMTLQGVPAALAVTGLRSTIASLLEPSKEATAVAKRLGIHWDAASLRALGLQGVLGQLAGNTKVTSEDMAKLTGRIEATNFVMAATSKTGVKNLNDALIANQNASKGAGASAESLAAAMDSPSSRWKEFTNTLNNASSALGSKFAPAASRTLVWLTDIAKGAQDGVLPFNALTIAVGSFALALLAVNLSAFLTGINAVARAGAAFSGLVAAFSGWGGVLANITGGFSVLSGSIWASVTAAGALQNTLIGMTGFGVIALAVGVLTMALVDLYAQWKANEVAAAESNAGMMAVAANLANAGKTVPGFAAQVQKAVRTFNETGNTEQFRQQLALLQEEFKKSNPELFFKQSVLKQQATLMKQLGTESVQSYKVAYEGALLQVDALKKLRAVPQDAKGKAELEANIKKAEVFLTMRKRTLDEALSGKKPGGEVSEDGKKLLAARQQIDEGIANLNQKSLSGIQAQFSEIDQSLNKLLRNPAITPEQRDKAQSAAVAARMAAVQDEEDQIAKVQAVASEHEFEASLTGIHKINAAVLEEMKKRTDAQKDIEQIGIDTRMALAETESQRLAIQNETQLADFRLKYAGIDNLAAMSDAFRIQLEIRSAAILSRQHDERMRNIQDEIAVLQAETSSPAGGQSIFNNRGIRDEAEIRKLTVEQQIAYNKARRDGALEDELNLLKQKQGLELIKLQQSQYDRMFDTVKGQAEGVFDAIFTRGKKGFDGLLDYIKGVFAVKVKDIFGTLVARLFSGARPDGSAQDTAGGLLGSILGTLGLRRPPSAQEAGSKEIADAVKAGVGTASKVASEASCACFQKGIEELKQTPAQSGGLLSKAAGIIGGVGGGIGALIGIAGKTAAATAAGPVGASTVTLTTEAGEVVGGLGAAGTVVGPAVAGSATAAAAAGEIALPTSIFTAGTAEGGTAAGGTAAGGTAAGGAASGGGGLAGFATSGLGAGLIGGAAGFAGGFGVGKALDIGTTRSAIAGGVGAAAGVVASIFLGPALGALVGAGVGALTAVSLRLLGGRSREAVLSKEIQRDFGIVVKDGAMLKKIKKLGEAAFGKDADKKRFETLRLPEVQNMLMNYAVQTGQDPSKLPGYQSIFGTGKTPDNQRIDVGSGGSAAGSSSILSTGIGVDTSSVGSSAGFAATAGGSIGRFTGGGISVGAELGVGGDAPTRARTTGGPVSVEQTVAPVIYISGAQDPYQTAKAVAKSVHSVATSGRRDLVRDLTTALDRDEGRRAFQQSIFGV